MDTCKFERRVKVKRLFNLLGITFMVLVFLSACSSQSKHPNEYYFQVENQDISLKDFYIFDTGEYTYVPSAFYFENHSNKEIEKISLHVYYENQLIYSLATAESFVDNKLYPNISETYQVTLPDNPQIVCQIEYWFDESYESQKISETVTLAMHEWNNPHK